MADINEKLLNDKLDYLYDTKCIFKDVLKDAGVVITEEDTLRDYVEKIKTIDTGEVRLFETEQKMQDYENPQENMLAVVYKSHINTMSMSEYMQYLVFQDDVALDEECTTNYNISLIDKNGVIVGNAYLTPVSFYFNINKNINIEINYTSTNGINYARVSAITNPVNIINPILTDVLPENLKWFKFFIRYENDEFNGLFKYINDTFIYIKNENEKSLESELDEVNRLVDIIRG